MKILKLLALFIFFTLIGCNDAKKDAAKPTFLATQAISKDSIIFSFVFTGCNRIEHGDKHNSSATNASTANIAALKSIINDITSLKNKPNAFFFLGDMVLGESNTYDLDKELKAWDAQINDPTFSEISTSGIEILAVPGNHEMLDRQELPLQGTTDVWMKYMSSYMPTNRSYVSIDSLDNRMTYAFTRKNIGFIVMNTDTYGVGTATNPKGLEGMVPTQWIIDKINTFKADATIQHIFVLGHKPYYSNNYPSTGHQGLPAGPVLWPVLNNAGVVAMLSAHVHDYQRMQPNDTGTYQIIAGNAGSSGPASFYGYSIINIFSNGNVQLITRGFTKSNPYYSVPNPTVFTTRDSTILTSIANANPYSNNFK